MKGDKKYWFPAKPPGFGWGWGLPITWQGWTVFILYLVLVLAASILLTPGSVPGFLTFIAAITTRLIGICLWKGEPPNARRQ